MATEPAPSGGMAIGGALMDPRMLWAIVGRRWWLIAGTFFLGVALACVYYVLASRTYEASAQIVVEHQDPSLSARGVERDLSQQLAVIGEDLLATHVQIITSTRIVKRALEERNLLALHSILAAKTSVQEPWDYVIANLQAVRGGDGPARTAHVLRVSLRHSDAADCQAILEAVVASYQQFLEEEFKSVNSEAVRLISQAQDRVGQELKAQEAEYVALRERTPLIWKKGDATTNIHRERLVEIEAALAEVRSQRSQVKARLEVMEAALAQPEAAQASELQQLALLNDRDVNRLNLLLAMENGSSSSEAFQAMQPARMEAARTIHEQLLALLRQEKTMLVKLGEEHPKVQQCREDIQAIRDFLQANETNFPRGGKDKMAPADLVQANLGLLRHDLSELSRREAELSALSETEHAAAKALVADELRVEVMRNQLDRLTQLYDVVLERLRDINLAKDYGGVEAKLITPVQLPKRPVWPRLSLVLALGGFLGLTAGAGLVLLGDLAEGRFHSSDEMRQVLQLPVLAGIPDFNRAAPRRRSSDAPSQASGQAASPRIATAVVTYHLPDSRISEAFRALRSAVFQGARDYAWRVVQVASPHPGDGRTTILANLAVSIAQAGKRVLLVDCDLRGGQVQRLFGADATAGLSGYLLHEAAMAQVIQATDVANLSVVPAGSPAAQPSELFYLPAFEQFLARARQEFDLVLLDGPPLLTVVDSRVLASHADGLLLAVRPGKGDRASALRAREMIAAVGRPVAGIVVSRLDPRGPFSSAGCVDDA